MLFTHTLFLVCACKAIASPWNGYHYYRHHQHLTEVASSDSPNPAASPVLVPATLPEKILASRQGDEEEYDECSDEDEESEDQPTQPQTIQAGPPPVSSPSPSPSPSPSTPPSSPGQNALYNVPGAGNPSIPYGNASFPAAQAIAASTSSAAPAPSPPASSESDQLTTDPTSGEGEAQQDGADGRPIVLNLPSSSAAPAAAAPSTAAAGNVDAAAGVLTASFTRYGAGDQDGSGNCNSATAACGFYNNPGYNAAVSQALFGVGPGAGAGPACGTCYSLMPVGGNSIVVKVNNLCPDDGNPLCAQPENVDVNFDLCLDDGAGPAMFGSGPQQLNGTAVQVDCSQWSGSTDLTSTS